MEKLKDVNSFEGIYYFGTDYNVYSYKTNNIIKLEKLKTGYNRITLYKNGVKYRISMHRLVAINFIENKMNKKCINHIDNNRENNLANNLEWCTYSENMQHMHNQKRHKRSNEGEINRLNAVKVKQGKLTFEQAEEIRNIEGLSYDKIAKIYNVSGFLIGRIKKNITYKREDYKLWTKLKD